MNTYQTPYTESRLQRQYYGLIKDDWINLQKLFFFFWLILEINEDCINSHDFSMAGKLTILKPILQIASICHNNVNILALF